MCWQQNTEPPKLLISKLAVYEKIDIIALYCCGDGWQCCGQGGILGGGVADGFATSGRWNTWREPRCGVG